MRRPGPQAVHAPAGTDRRSRASPRPVPSTEYQGSFRRPTIQTADPIHGGPWQVGLFVALGPSLDRIAEAIQLHRAGHITAQEYALILSDERERERTRLAGRGLGVAARRRIAIDRDALPERKASSNVTRAASVETAPSPVPASSAATAFGLPFDDLVKGGGSSGGEAADFLSLPHWRRPESVKALRAIADRNPDTSLALSTARRVSATPLTVAAYRIGAQGPTEDPDEAALLETQRFLARSLEPWGGGAEAMRDLAMDGLMVQGGAGFELEVTPDGRDAQDIIAVDPTRVRHKAAKDATGRGYVRAFYVPEGSGATATPRPFNPVTFVYVALDASATDPHGRPWILPALDTAPAQSRMRNVLHSVAIHQGFGRLGATVDWDRIAATIPDGLTPAQKRTEMAKALGAITNTIRQLKPDDAVANWDFIKMGVIGAQHGSQSLKPKELADTYDTDLAAGLKTPPALLGRSTGQALSTNADVQWKVYAQQLEGLRERALAAVGDLLTKYLRLRGFAAYVVVTAEAIEKTDAQAEETTAKTRQERLLAARDAGIVDDAFVRDEMGYPEPTGPLIGRAEPDAARLTADDEAALVAHVLSDCPECGSKNLRRRPGQQKCRACGVQLEARRSASEADAPDEADCVTEAATDCVGQPLPFARAYVDAYADCLDALDLDDGTDCTECPDWRAAADPQRAARLEPSGRALGAVELGAAFGTVDADALTQAIRAWRTWAASSAPDFERVLEAEAMKDKEARRATSDEELTVPAGGLALIGRAGAASKGYAWDARALAYRPAASPERPISGATIARLLEDRMADHRAEIARVSGRFSRGEIGIDAWQRGMATTLRTTHLQARALAVGGRERMGPADFGSVGGLMRMDLQRLARFGAQAAAGQLTAPQIEARAALYGQANIRRTYERGRLTTTKEAGWQQERRILAGGAAHCEGCRDEAARGWVQLGTLAPIGGHACRANDQCGKEHRYSAASRTVPRASNGSTGAWPRPAGVGRLAPNQEGGGLANLATQRIGIGAAAHGND